MIAIIVAATLERCCSLVGAMTWDSRVLVRTDVAVGEACRTHCQSTVEDTGLHMGIAVVVEVACRDYRVPGRVSGMDTRTGKDCMVASWEPVGTIARHFLDRDTSD